MCARRRTGCGVRWGLKVTIEDKKGSGKVIIEYAGVDDFDAILAALGQ